MLNVDILPAFEDNYIYMIRSGGRVGVIDPGDAAPVIEFLKTKNLMLDFIFNTHHHHDHIGGNAALQECYGAKIVSPDPSIPFGDVGFKTIKTPGHTQDHVCFYSAEGGVLFSGDTLFSMGCGRLFEGTAAEMFESLQKIKALPPETKIYCGHEYTLDNGVFCLAQEPENMALKARVEEVKKLRAAGKPTLPITLAEELKTNVFLRAETVEAFTRLRTLKDSF